MTQSRAAHFAARPATSTGPGCSESSAASAQSRLFPAVCQPIPELYVARRDRRRNRRRQHNWVLAATGDGWEVLNKVLVTVGGIL
jgi:hypothetical protein